VKITAYFTSCIVQVSAGGKPSTVAAYASDATTPSYKAAFGSGEAHAVWPLVFLQYVQENQIPGNHLTRHVKATTAIMH
jgi:hypothetical protein